MHLLIMQQRHGIRVSTDFQMGKTFKIITLGCKVNQCESAYLREALMRAGWIPAEKGGLADVSIVNTCVVTQRASYQSRQAIRKAIRENPSTLTAATGCYAQAFPEELSRIEGLDLVAGNALKGHLHKVLQDCGKGAPTCLTQGDFSAPLSEEILPLSERTRSFLKIQDGCDSFCSYCIVPFSRGPLRSLEPLKVIALLRSLSEEGYKEVVLTGIHLGKYGIDLSPATSLKDLLRLIGQGSLPLRIRLSSIEPKEVVPDLIRMAASEEWLCRHFHIPLQSGDNGILKRMNRNYTSEEYARLVESIHSQIPLAAIGVDIMAGFPGEEDKAYRNTYDLVKDLPVSYFHVFPFSPRKGTAAWDFKDKVNDREIKKRGEGLRVLGQKKREAFYRSCVGKTFQVLAQGLDRSGMGMNEGLSDNYLPVLFPFPREIRNEMLPIRIEKVEKLVVFGSPETVP
jgi:threonylcarbamoyladenosine tRNA methylthiotransferase MtaB